MTEILLDLALVFFQIIVLVFFTGALVGLFIRFMKNQ